MMIVLGWVGAAVQQCQLINQLRLKDFFYMYSDLDVVNSHPRRDGWLAATRSTVMMDGWEYSTGRRIWRPASGSKRKKWIFNPGVPTSVPTGRRRDEEEERK